MTAGSARRQPSGPLRLLAGAYAALTIATLVAWWVVGDRWWTQPLHLTTFWWTLPAVPLAALAVILRSRRTALLLAVPALLWLWAYGTAFLPNGPSPAADLRVVSFNTYVHAPDHSHVLGLVEDLDPDVLILQEVFPDREAALREALAQQFPTQEVVQSPGVGGVGVFSQHPVRAVRPIGDAAENSRSMVVVELEVDGRPLQVVPVHLLSPCPSCGPSMLERMRLEGDVRRAEMGAVLDALDPTVPAIVGGDFNSTDRSEPYRRLVGAGFLDPQRDAGSGMGFTWPADGSAGPVLRIDWILARGLLPVDAAVAPPTASDHLPIVVDLAFPKAP